MDWDVCLVQGEGCGSAISQGAGVPAPAQSEARQPYGMPSSSWD